MDPTSRTEPEVTLIGLPTISCRHCNRILLVMWGPEVGVAEYFEKVVLHESECGDVPHAWIDLCLHYELLDDDPAFNLNTGDVLVCMPYDHDPEKLTVCMRLGDDYEPHCNIDRHRVRLVAGNSAVRLRREAPYGFERIPLSELER